MGTLRDEFVRALGLAPDTSQEEKPMVSGLSGMRARLLQWSKFPAELYGADLKVALESTFPKGLMPIPNPQATAPKSIPADMTYESQNITRYYHPAFGGDSEIIFVPRLTRDGELFRRLMFRRKMSRENPHEGRMEMRMARFGEEKPFGFSCWKQGDPGSPGYVALAYPGMTPKFVPVYVRIESFPLPAFLKIEAEDVDAGVCVRVTNVTSEEVPPTLRDKEENS